MFNSACELFRDVGVCIYGPPVQSLEHVCSEIRPTLCRAAYSCVTMHMIERLHFCVVEMDRIPYGHLG